MKIEHYVSMLGQLLVRGVAGVYVLNRTKTVEHWLQ